MYNNIEVEQWIGDWINLFPKGIRSGGKLVRGDKKEILKKMKAFIKDYGYTPDEIFEATSKYITERATENYLYTRCAVYFIGKKGEGSDLASEIANINDSPEEEIIEDSYFG